jgi:hypothetical protein
MADTPNPSGPADEAAAVHFGNTESINKPAAGPINPAETAIREAGIFSRTPGMNDGREAADGVAKVEAADGKPATAEPKVGAGDKPVTDTAVEAALTGDYSAIVSAEHLPVFAPALAKMEKAELPDDFRKEILAEMVGTHQELAKEVRTAIVKENEAQWGQAAVTWRAETDKKFTPAEQGQARQALLRVFDKPTIDYLEKVKFTDNPALVGAMVRVAKAIADDTWVTGGPASSRDDGAETTATPAGTSPIPQA